ncbi:hypothetical protein K435DRAFT_803469 [Dendrothele bispora CBS 962.96]|uniref:Uncharacterized protein n=1 Tax=Dendrothele bispora (strain CBS 962.96) TaxID=1314807 RepID=A0A4S8LHF1_DENBC|nr:hypothetical protein K435DRAFT_803469 [Dendrothele bispora CBS 962.96]
MVNQDPKPRSRLAGTGCNPLPDPRTAGRTTPASNSARAAMSDAMSDSSTISPALVSDEDAELVKHRSKFEQFAAVAHKEITSLPRRYDKVKKYQAIGRFWPRRIGLFTQSSPDAKPKPGGISSSHQVLSVKNSSAEVKGASQATTQGMEASDLEQREWKKDKEAGMIRDNTPSLGCACTGAQEE